MATQNISSSPNHVTGVLLGENVHRLRVDQGLPKKTFASMADISRPQLDKIERGEADPRMSCIMRLADGLSVSPGDLLTFPETK